MIGSDTPMVLCVHRCGTHYLEKVIYLGYAILDGNEYSQLNDRAKLNGNYVMLRECSEEVQKVEYIEAEIP